MGNSISLQFFKGEIEKVDTISLPEFNAQLARNCDFREGKLKPYSGLTTISTPSKTGTKKTIYRFDPTPGNDSSGYFFHWTDDVDVVKGPVPGDTVEMTYFTGDGDPKFTDSTIATSGGTDYPENSFLLGIPQPTGPGSYAVSGTAPETDDLYVNTTYAVTYVGARGEEGPPAYADTLQVGPSQQVDITSMPTGPTGNYDVTHKRIYRTASGSNSTRFFLVTEVTVATTSYSDTKSDADLGVELVSQTHEPPPTAAHSLGLTSNGIMFMCKENRLVLSEAYLPYAYNPLNEKTTDYPIVGAGTYQNVIVALTERMAWLTVGSDPRSMSLRAVKTSHGCVSKRSIASSDNGVLYASDFGLMLIGPGGLLNISERYMTQKQWRAYVPTSMHGVIYDDKYFCFYDQGGVSQGALVFDLLHPEDGFAKISVNATAAFTDELSGRLFLQVGDDIVAWDDDDVNPLITTWWSREYFSGNQEEYTAARVIAESYNDTSFSLYVDGVFAHYHLLTNDAPFRLPPVRGETVSMLIVGSDVVRRVDMAETVNDLRDR